MDQPSELAVGMWLVKNYSNLEKQLMQESLKNLSIQSMREMGLVASTHKTGLNFLDEKLAKTSLRKFFQSLERKFIKDAPYLKTTDMLNPFIEDVNIYNAKVVFVLLNDPLTERYISRLNRALHFAGIPLAFTQKYDSTILTTKYDLRYVKGSTTEIPSSNLKLYRLFFYLGDMMNVLNTLKRKAVYAAAESRKLYSNRLVVPGIGTNP